MTNFLLIFGLMFPMLSLITTIICAIESRRTGKRCSAILIPFIGPILLSLLVLITDRHWWLIPVFWLTDIGTLAFLSVLPALAREWWETSALTLEAKFVGTWGNATATLTLHRGGRYLMRKEWTRSKNELGIIQIGELGNYCRTQNDIELHSDSGRQRILIPIEDSIYRVEELANSGSGQDDYSIAGWNLHITND